MCVTLFNWKWSRVFSPLLCACSSQHTEQFICPTTVFLPCMGLCICTFQDTWLQLSEGLPIHTFLNTKRCLVEHSKKKNKTLTFKSYKTQKITESLSIVKQFRFQVNLNKLKPDFQVIYFSLPLCYIYYIYYIKNYFSRIDLNCLNACYKVYFTCSLCEYLWLKRLLLGRVCTPDMKPASCMLSLNWLRWCTVCSRCVAPVYCMTLT